MAIESMYVFTGDEVIATDLPAKLNENFAKTENGITNLENKVIPISQGGTSATTVAGARNNLGLGNTSGALPIANGGTGATTASDACANIGALPTTGGTMTGGIYNKTYINTGLFMGNNDNGGTLGEEGSNINIKSWYGIGFVNGYTGGSNYNKTTIGFDVRSGRIFCKDIIVNESSLPPIGTVLPFGGENIPYGYLPCNGSAISRTTYAKLFDVIGTIYGTGDGSTTFNLPNLNNNSFLEGSDTAGTVKSAGLPNITGDSGFNADIAFANGAFYRSAEQQRSENASGGNYGDNMGFDASRCSSIYGNSTTVQPKSVTVKFCIKY